MSSEFAQNNEQFPEPVPEIYTPENVIYTALFIDEESKSHLLTEVSPEFEKVYAHHLTLSFRPTDGINGITLGKKRPINLIGQVIDMDLGIQAALVEPNQEVKSTNLHPHITISGRNGTKPVKSNEAIEKAIAEGTVIYFDDPIKLEVTEGFFNGSNVVTAVP